MSSVKQRYYWKPILGVVTGGILLIWGGSCGAIWTNNKMGDFLVGSSPVSAQTISPQNGIDENAVVNENANPNNLVQSNFVERQWLVEPRMASTFITILFTVSVGGLSILFVIWGVGFSILNANANILKQELKNDHDNLSDEIDKNAQEVNEAMNGLLKLIKLTNEKVNISQEEIIKLSKDNINLLKMMSKTQEQIGELISIQKNR